MNSILSIEAKFIQNLTEIVKANFGNEQFGVDELAKELGMSRATLHRKIKAATNKTATQFINEIRLNEADLLLRNRAGNVSEIAYLVGFQSSTYFIKCYGEHFGYPPGEVLKANHPKNGNGNNLDTRHSKVTLHKSFVWLLLFILLFIAGKTGLHRVSGKPDNQSKAITTNITALNLYNQGANLMDVYTGSRKEEHFLEAKSLFEKAVQLDSTFGDAYLRIANIYFTCIPFSPKTNKGFSYADSGKIYLDLAEKYGITNKDFMLRTRSVYCQRTANFDEALRLFEKRWGNKEKDYNYYHERGNQAFHARNYYETIKYLMKYLELKPDSVLPAYDRVQKLGLTFSYAGFQKASQEFTFRQFQLTNDQIRYWNRYPIITYECGDFAEALKTYEAAYSYNNVSWTVYTKLFELYMLTGQDDKALKILPEFESFIQEKYNRKPPNYLLGYYHFLNGEQELAEWHFSESIKQLENYLNRSKFQQAMPNYVKLAACYAMLNNKEGTIRSLEKLKEKTSIPYFIVLQLQCLPLFNNLKGDKDFEKIKSQIEQKYYNEREKIEKVLNESNIKYTFNLEGSVVPTPL